MLRFQHILAGWLIVASAVVAGLGDEAEAPRHIDARVEFIRLIRHIRKGRTYVGMLVKSGSSEHLQLLIPLRTDENGERVLDRLKIAEARRLRRNQEILVTYYIHDNRIWVHQFSAVRE